MSVSSVVGPVSRDELSSWIAPNLTWLFKLIKMK